MGPWKALQWMAAGFEGFKVQLEPLFHAEYRAAREAYGRRTEESTPRYLYVVLSLCVVQMFSDPHPTIRAFFAVYVTTVGTVWRGVLPKNVNVDCFLAVATGILILVFRMHVMGEQFFTMGYDVKAMWLGPITCFGLGARSGMTLSVVSYFLIMLQASEYVSHTLSNARVVLFGSAVASLLSEAGRIREEFVARQLQERTAEAKEFEVKAIAAEAEAAHARAAQLAAEAERARAGQLRAKDQHRTMERLYHKALTQVKVPLVLARSEMQACESGQTCPGCRAARHRIDELWQLLTAPEAAPQQADEAGTGAGAGAGAAGGSDRQAASGAGVPEGLSSPSASAASSSSVDWSYDPLHEFKDVAMAFDAERFTLQRVTMRFQEPGADCGRQMPRLDQLMVPAEWRRLERWLQNQVNDIVNEQPTRDYEGPLQLRWPGETSVQAKVARVVWLEEPLDESAAGREEPTEGQLDGGSDQGSAGAAEEKREDDDDEEESDSDGHFALVLSELSLPVARPDRQRRRRRRRSSGGLHGPRDGGGPASSRGQGPLLDCVEEFCSVDADSLEEEEEAAAGDGGRGP